MSIIIAVAVGYAARALQPQIIAVAKAAIAKVRS